MIDPNAKYVGYLVKIKSGEYNATPKELSKHNILCSTSR